MTDRLRATYLLETAYPIDQAVASMAGEQSTGTFVKLPSESDELLRAHAARVESVEKLETVSRPSLPGAGVAPGRRGDAAYQRARVEISWPVSNLGTNLPTALATVAGNLFELKPVSGLRLLDIHFPDTYAEKYPGPQFSIAGTRRLSGVHDRPLVGTIVKPSVGLSPEATAAVVDELCRGGIDFIKDDELQADGPHCPFSRRLPAVMRVLDRHSDRLGRQVMYAFNITGDLDEMRQRHDAALAAGATCIMVSLNSIGLTGFLALRRHSQLPIHAHRNGWGYLSRHPLLGFDYVAWQKIWRLAGADHMHVNGLRNKFCESDESVIASARACLAPMFDHPGKGYEVMPVFSSGQWAGQAPDTYKALGSIDLINACGGGIMAHPGGIAAGVLSIRQAWQAAVAGRSLDDYAREHPELRQALDYFS